MCSFPAAGPKAGSHAQRYSVMWKSRIDGCMNDQENVQGQSILPGKKRRRRQTDKSLGISSLRLLGVCVMGGGAQADPFSGCLCVSSMLRS